MSEHVEQVYGKACQRTVQGLLHEEEKTERPEEITMKK